LNRENGSFGAVMQRITATPAAAHSRRAAYLLLAGVVVLWGANWPVMKLGLAELPPFWFAAIRVILGAFCLFAVLALGGNLALPGRRDMVQLLGGGIERQALHPGESRRLAGQHGDALGPRVGRGGDTGRSQVDLHRR